MPRQPALSRPHSPSPSMYYPFAVQVRPLPQGVIVVRVMESLDAEAVPRFGETLQQIMDKEKATRLVLDLSLCDQICSMGLGMLHFYKTQADKKGGDLMIAAAQPFVAKMIKITLGTEMVRMWNDVNEALTAFGIAVPADSTPLSSLQPPPPPRRKS